MAKHGLKCWWAAYVVFALLLSAALCPAQSKRLAPARVGQGSHAVNRSNQAPGPAAYTTFSYIDSPQTPYTGPLGINLGAASAKMEIVGVYGPDDPSGPGFRLFIDQTKNATTLKYESVSFGKFTNQGADDGNDFGQVVGNYLDGSGNIHGYAFDHGHFTKIEVPFKGAISTAANGINNAGDIVGDWQDSSGVQHAFVLSGGVYSSFDYPGDTFTGGFAINNNGDVVGMYYDTAGDFHGYLFSSGLLLPSMFRAQPVPSPTGSMTAGRWSARTARPRPAL